MDAMVIRAAFVGSIATAFVVERAVLGVLFHAFRALESHETVIIRL